MRTILLAFVLGIFAPGTSIAAPVAPAAAAPVLVSVAQAAPIEVPSQTIEQRNNRAYWHVFMAFAAAWLLLLLYIVTIGRRFGKLEEEIRQLRRS